MKKLISLLLTGVLLMTAVPSVVHADTETSTNNTSSTATKLVAGSAITAEISSKDDWDFYVYTVNVEGYVTFTIKDINSTGHQWYMTIYSEEMNLMEETPLYCDGYKAVSKQYNFSKGTKLYVEITCGTYDAVGNAYSLEVKEYQDDSWEVEDNGKAALATELKADETITGNFNYCGDADFYKYTFDANGYVEFEMLNKSNYTNVINIYNTSLQQIGAAYAYGGTTSTTFKYAFKKGETIYLQIFYANYYHGENYTITPRITTSNAWETESNNSIKFADEIALNKKITAVLTQVGLGEEAYKDTDVFSYTADTPGTSTVAFTVKNKAVYGWHVKIMDSSEKVLAVKKSVKSNTKIKVKLKKGETCYIKVTAESSNIDVSNMEYNLKITQ